jgi:hypothetical protein
VRTPQTSVIDCISSRAYYQTTYKSLVQLKRSRSTRDGHWREEVTREQEAYDSRRDFVPQFGRPIRYIAQHMQD